MRRTFNSSRQIVAILALLVTSGNLRSGAASNPTDDFSQAVFAFEFLTYKRGEQTQLEIFCEIPAHVFQYVKYRDGFHTRYEVSIAVRGANGKKIHTASYVDSAKVTSFEEITKAQTQHLIRFSLFAPPGEYLGKMVVTDLETGNEIIDLSRSIVLPNYHNSRLALSDLQISADVRASDTAGMLVKNKYKVIPNVRRIVSSEADFLYLYSEVYNLQYPRSATSGDLQITYAVEDKNGIEIMRRQRRVEKPGSSSVVAVRIFTEDLHIGTYKLHLWVEDLDSGEIAAKSTSFIVVDQSLDRI